MLPCVDATRRKAPFAEYIRESLFTFKVRPRLHLAARKAGPIECDISRRETSVWETDRIQVMNGGKEGRDQLDVG